MAGIDRVGFNRTAPLRPWGRTPAASGFSVPEDDIQTGSVATPVAINGPFSFQDAPAHDETPAREQASTLLFELAALQRSMLGGGDPAVVLQRLDGMLSAAPGAASPPMLALLAAVRLRAKVELARRRSGQFR